MSSLPTNNADNMLANMRIKLLKDSMKFAGIFEKALNKRQALKLLNPRDFPNDTIQNNITGSKKAAITYDNAYEL